MPICGAKNCCALRGDISIDRLETDVVAWLCKERSSPCRASKIKAKPPIFAR